MIEDAVLRDLFQAESDEHLQRLDAGLLRLERTPGDRVLLDEVFREAHSLKGAARMLGLDRLQALAHGFEEVLDRARRGDGVLAPDTPDRLSRALSALEALAREAVRGEPAELDVDVVLGEIGATEARGSGGVGTGAADDVGTGAASSAGRAAEDAGKPIAPLAGVEAAGDRNGNAVAVGRGAPQGEHTPAAPGAGGAVSSATPGRGQHGAAGEAAPAAYRIDTVRVPTERLDALLANAGELAVTRGRIQRRLVELDGLLALLDGRTRATGVRLGADGAASGGEGGDDRSLRRVRRALGDDCNDLERIAGQIAERAREFRLLPLSTMFRFFPRFVRDLGRERGKPARLDITGGETPVDKRIVEELKDPLTHLLRNAIDHGIEHPELRRERGKSAEATILLSACRVAGQIVIEVADDGAGLDRDAIVLAAVAHGDISAGEGAALTDSQVERLIFRAGLSTAGVVTETSGRGVGMDVVRTNVERLEGSIELASRPGVGLTVRIRLPLALGATRVLLVRCGSAIHGLPIEEVVRARFVEHAALTTIGGRRVAAIDGETLPVASLADLLGIPGAPDAGPADGPANDPANDPMSDMARGAGDGLRSRRHACVIVSSAGQRLGLLVDELVGDEEVVLRPQPAFLRRMRNVAGAALLDSGEVCSILRPADLVGAAADRVGRGDSPTAARAPSTPPGGHTTRPIRTVLLVEDSITTRTQERRILEAAGYRVVTAVDGVDALDRLAREPVHAVVSDIDMPNLDGLALTRRIRANPRHHGLPVVLVSSLASDRDKRAGLEAGADAYITKTDFDQSVLLESLARLA